MDFSGQEGTKPIGASRIYICYDGRGRQTRICHGGRGQPNIVGHQGFLMVREDSQL